MKGTRTVGNELQRKAGAAEKRQQREERRVAKRARRLAGPTRARLDVSARISHIS
jgi:hypothetical protein